MDFIAKRIWYITIPTAMAVLVFQLYWLHNTYINQQTNFKQTATVALQKAYDATILETVAGHNYEQQTTNISITDTDTAKATKTKETKEEDKPTTPLLKEISPATVKIGSADTDIGQLLSGILSMSLSGAVNPSMLEKNYRNGLKNQGITIQFKLVIYKKGQAVPNSDDSNFVQTKVQGNTIRARFAGVNKLLIVKMIWPIVLSFLLVMLITGCIWILWRIIDKQKKLEVMKNDFISNISHELKTPLSILNTTNDVLLNFEGMKNPEKTERYLNLSRNELQKLQHLIDNILDLTKMEHTDNKLGPFEKINLKDLLKATVLRFKELPGIDIELDLKINDKVIKTWPEALKTIVSNLIDNAIKYTSTSDKYIKISVTEDQRFYWLSVSDQGIGIPEHHQSFIFDKFYRVPQGNLHDVKGYGLGLSHVKSLLSKMDAKISVSSKLMEGSVFTVQLKKND
ncbi:sensor histidine kinase [Pedobacter sp. UBA5917]|jgi:two-component system phosphate regulon sensor histidine kinase PhoR|uniref:sensor histidine kinase n=1 Tax=Pedobacter sp. UBA5917 TaxID=1947061 RepID=UPI0025D87758|nr:HAMP domain-containing sensor histidine kinase [Pedobacter sp. UBA5917]